MINLNYVFRCVARSVCARGVKALIALPLGPFAQAGEFIYDVARDVWQQLRKEAQEEQFLNGLGELAAASPDELQEAAQQVAREAAALDPLEDQLVLTSYLTGMQAQVRRTSLGSRSRGPLHLDPSPVSIEELVAILPPAPGRFRPGDCPTGLAHRQLIELLGVGGYGEVWKARDPQFEGIPPVALKFCTAPRAAEWLRHEATLLDRVMRAGPLTGIVPLRNRYLDADPPCLEYEFVEGGDLTALIRQARELPSVQRIRLATDLVRQIAGTLGKVHRLDPPIVHRDLKPSNILVTHEDGVPSLKVTDFGIGGLAARVLAEEPGGGRVSGLLATRLRGAHSPLYASPQQKEGQPPDPRDDVFALGVLWYQLLIGDPGQELPTELTQDLQEAGAGGTLARLLGRCVDRRADRRPADAAVLADEIERLPALAPLNPPPALAPLNPPPLASLNGEVGDSPGLAPTSQQMQGSPAEVGQALLPECSAFLPEFRIPQFRPYQEEAVRALLGNARPLVVLPTSAGKSLCYQLPALALFRRAGRLTVIVSPLQALMEDQVLDLQDRGLDFATYVNGNLDPTRRQRRLERVREGKVGLLYLSPEALRSQGIHALFRDRPPACWVLDEAHCVSQWGHDFRPDYCYVPKFIRQLIEEQRVEPLLALFTATATVAVQEDVRKLFEAHDLTVGPAVVSDAARPNLNYRVVPVNANKDQVLLREVRHTLEQPGCVLVYTTTRREAERLAHLIREVGVPCRHYHGGMGRREKREVLEDFKAGELRAVAATCAFGMGINRPDVRAVIHHCMSTSLEAYVQESGRAGRDGAPASCTLLFREEDADLLFSLRARGHLSDHDLKNVFTVVRALRNRVHRSTAEDWFWASPAEVLRETVTPEDADLGAEERDTRLRVAVHLLEDFKMLERDVNLSSCLRFDLKHADPAGSEKLIRDQPLGRKEADHLVRLARSMHALRGRPENADGPLPAAELCDVAGLAADQLFNAVRELHLLGVCTFEVPLSLIFTRADNQYGARQRHRWLREVEAALLACLRELVGDHGAQLNLRGVVNRLKLTRKEKPRAAALRELLDAWAEAGWLRVESVAPDVVRLHGLEGVEDPLRRRWEIGEASLDVLYGRAQGDESVQRVQVELGRLMELGGEKVRPPVQPAELECVLGWLHDRDVVRIDEGLNLVRQAFKLRVFKGKQLATITRLHRERVEPRYEDQYRRTHLMVRYGNLGIQDPAAARQLIEDYFRLPREEFDARQGLNRRAERAALRKPILPGDERRILDDLNEAQKEIVNAEDPACMLLDALRKGLRTVVGPTEKVEDRVRAFFQRSGRSSDEPTVRALIRVAEDLDRERGSGSTEAMLPLTAEEVIEAIHEFDAANETHRDEGAVLVTSCHGAKGLEFRKVVLLADGFDPGRTDVERAGSNEAAWEERRRLFYVAMTRAKEDLVLCETRRNRLVKETGLIVRAAPAAGAALPGRLVYLDLTPEDVDLGHRATRTQQELIKRLPEGTGLRLEVNHFGDGWRVCTAQGVEIGDLSRKADQRLRELGLGANSFEFKDGEVRVGRVFRHLKFNEVTGEKVEDWFVVIPQIRVCR